MWLVSLRWESHLITEVHSLASPYQPCRPFLLECPTKEVRQSFCSILRQAMRSYVSAGGPTVSIEQYWTLGLILILFLYDPRPLCNTAKNCGSVSQSRCFPPYGIYIFAMYSWRSMFDTKAVYFVTLRVRAQWNTLWIPCWKCWRKMSLTTARPVQNTLSFSRVMPVLWVSVCIYRPVSCMYVASPLSKHVHVYTLTVG